MKNLLFLLFAAVVGGLTALSLTLHFLGSEVIFATSSSRIFWIALGFIGAAIGTLAWTLNLRNRLLVVVLLVGALLGLLVGIDVTFLIALK